MSSPQYGYFSSQQSKLTKCEHVYLDTNGNEVYVSQVNEYKLQDDEIHKYFSDNKYVGKVTKYLRNVKL